MIFGMHVHNIITTVNLINILISLCSYLFCMCVLRKPEIYFPSKFQLYNTIFLTIVTNSTLYL